MLHLHNCNNSLTKKSRDYLNDDYLPRETILIIDFQYIA